MSWTRGCTVCGLGRTLDVSRASHPVSRSNHPCHESNRRGVDGLMVKLWNENECYVLTTHCHKCTILVLHVHPSCTPRKFLDHEWFSADFRGFMSLGWENTSFRPRTILTTPRAVECPVVGVVQLLQNPRGSRLNFYEVHSVTCCFTRYTWSSLRLGCKHPSDVNQLLLRFVKVDNYNDGMDNGVQRTLGGQGAGLEPRVFFLTLLRWSPSAMEISHLIKIMST
jgi:hypothetical protein